MILRCSIQRVFGCWSMHHSLEVHKQRAVCCAAQNQQAEQHSLIQQQQQQQQEQLKPARRRQQLWKAKLPKRRPRLLDAPSDSSDPMWGTSKRQRKEALQQQLEQEYGPQAGDRDVRLYLKRRQLNAARAKPTRRGGIPLDDSFEKPGTFLKLSKSFQRRVLCERVEELTKTLPKITPEAAWQLYTTVPGLLALSTMEVAQRLTGLAHALNLSKGDTLQYCCTFRPMVFLDPDTILSRVGLLAKVTRLQQSAAVVLMQQHPVLWCMNGRVLGARVEHLSLLLHCCPVTSVKLIGKCPELLTAPVHTQQLRAICSLFGAQGQPDRVLPLLLWQPALLLHWSSHTQQQIRADQGAEQECVVGQQAAGMDPVQQLAEQMETLSSVLGFPKEHVQALVMRVPDLLQVAAQGPKFVAAAADLLSSSWVMDPAAVKEREQYQQHLLHLLQPSLYSSKASRQRVQPVSTAAGWFDIQQVTSDAAAECQWWVAAKQQQQLGWQSDLTALQQLLMQAPALLVLMGAAAAAAAGGVNSNATIQGLGAQRSETGGALDSRLQQISDVLSQAWGDVLLEECSQQQQQQRLLPLLAPSLGHQTPVQAQSEQLCAMLKRLVVLEPCALTQPPQWICTQVQQLSGALQISAASVLSLLLQHPGLLWVTPAQVFEQIRVLCGVLRLPAAQVKDLVAAPDAALVLLVHAEAVKRHCLAAMQAVSEMKGVDGRLRQAVKQQPGALLPGRWQELKRLL